MKIISISRRTDIPAFYCEWLLKRLSAGYCHWINPYGGQVQRVSLSPQDCLALAFWTRNPKPLLPHLTGLRDAGHLFYIHFTINGYPTSIESNNPPLRASIETFRRASEIVGLDYLFWRYDPILLCDATPADYHVHRFENICRELQGQTRRCYFSFVDLYGKTKRNIGRLETETGWSVQEPELDERLTLTRKLRDIAGEHGITLYSCCGDELAGDGVEKAHCIDRDVIEALRPDALPHLKKMPTRQDCGCVETADIGAYDTCAFGCVYCYATNSRQAAIGRMRNHNPDDTVLWRPSTLTNKNLEELEKKRKSDLAQPDLIQLATVPRQSSLFEDL
jgi:hypothetical protein